MCHKTSLGFRVSGRDHPVSGHRSRVAGPQFDSGLVTRDSRPRQRGFSIITAVFVLVVLALLAAFIVSVTGLQSASQQLDVQGVRAYQAARAGVEWGAFQVLDPNNNPATCSPVSMANCPATTDITTLAGSLAPFTVTVRCTFTLTTEGNRDVRVYQITADACNQPTGTSCPNTGTPAQGYVSRQITTVLSKCKDATATPPRCACG